MTNPGKTVLIYNPKAGKFSKRGEGLLEAAVKILREAGHEISVAPTTGPRTAGSIAREQIANGAGLILAAGGDGTINEVAEGMLNSEVPLGILPAGTANVLANELGIGSDMERAARHLRECRAERISVGHLVCDGGAVSRHFLLMAGVGLDAHIVYNVSAGLKAWAGKAAYWVAGWTMLGRRLPEFQAWARGESRRCSFALVTKVRNYGGDFEIAREVRIFDDCFEAIFFRGSSTLPYVKYFVGMALNRLKGMNGVDVLRAPFVRLSGPDDDRIYVQIDGEFAGHLPAEIRIVPGALTLLVPPKYQRNGQPPC